MPLWLLPVTARAQEAAEPGAGTVAPGRSAPTGASRTAARDFRVASGPSAVQLVELYSSQGCSSCPPAERFLSGLLESEDLFVGRVPLNFHVTYWDRLGWPDRYARRAYTERQYAYTRTLGLPSAYTPGFIVDGKEWRGFFSQKALPAPPAGAPGDLRARVEDGELALTFVPAPQASEAGDVVDALDFYVALLGVGLCDRIGAGENRGRRLRQDFLVLALDRVAARHTEGAFSARTAIPQASGPAPERYALGIWVTDTRELTPIQAAGGWLDAHYVSKTSSRPGPASCSTD